MRHPRLLSLVLAVVAAFASTYSPSAQVVAKKALSIDDYPTWRSINAAEISGDGKWVAYVLQQTNTLPAEAKPVVHLVKLETNEDIAIADATAPAFSADSRWVAYQVDPGAARRGREGRGGSAPTAPAVTTPPPAGTPPAQAARGNAGPIPPRRVDLRNLATGEVRSWQEIESFTFSPASTHLVLRRRPAEAGEGRGGRAGGAAPGGAPAAGRGGGRDEPAGPRGVDVILVDLGTGRHQLLGSVADIAFNRSGGLLAYTVDAAIKDGNGLFVFDTRTGRVTALDNDARRYNRLAWSEDGTALAVLKGLDVEKMRERDNLLIAFPDVQTAISGPAPVQPVMLDPSKAGTFAKGWVISDRAPLGWSEDNGRVFFGMKEQIATPPSDDRRIRDEVTDVDIWNTADERIQSVQMIRADADRNFTFRQAFDVRDARYVKLADVTLRELEIAQDGRWAVGRDVRGYVSDHAHPAADFHRVNTSTGERTLMLKGQLAGRHAPGIAPDGRHFLYWKDGKYHVYDLDAGATKTLGGRAAVSFADSEFDHPGPRPPYGLAGYAADGSAAIVQHKYDLWRLPLDGSAAVNLTGGAGGKHEIRFRPVRIEPIDPLLPPGPRNRRGTFDLSKPVTLAAYGEYTKTSGFYELSNGTLTPLIYEDAVFTTPEKAAKADTFLFTRQTFTEYPNLRVAGPGFKDAKEITDANPQQADYLWGRRVLFEYRNKAGVRLQGILALPDDYQPGEKRPMLVTFYEKNSQNMHRYSAPAYLSGMGSSPMEAVSRGYITMLPDVHFTTGRSHTDMLECVEAATRKVIELGYADPKRIGVTGHSYGGEGAAFIGTQSKLFAAVGMGAGVTDLFSDFSQNWGWSYQVTGGSGANGSNYYLYGQGRWGVSPWENPELYRFESALSHANKAAAPFLIMHGTADPTVAFANALGFYNALRFNGKQATLLAYPNEGHGLRGIANRRDLTIRFFQFFDHHLKGAPAPTWMTEGVPYLNKK
ncbi:MAG TPA: prolyl oligopeptidase family serine peptidase [Vicinamibacterales bacterium]|nr:prolyl oligopeptidase family serine peptidase [Vicinamibacterales bacterium]